MKDYSEISIEFLKNKEIEMLQKKFNFDFVKEHLLEKEIISNSDQEI